MNLLLRIGPFGQIGVFRCQMDFDLQRGQQVICRTARGLEVGEFLSLGQDEAASSDQVIGELVRTMTAQDELLLRRLNQNKLQAINECQAQIDSRGLSVAILDAELTFDGKRLYFYFSGDCFSGDGGKELDEITESLAETFDTHVKFSEFAETLVVGCGPECGTSEGNGCQDSGCGSCGLKSSCKA